MCIIPIQAKKFLEKTKKIDDILKIQMRKIL